MRGTIQKLKSQTGASITFALLLFLVCAVISSVVIVAATTAAGRMSQLPEMDQRYYAVTSAAGLLNNEIDRKRVEVEYDTKANTATTKVYDAEGSEPTVTVAYPEGAETILTEATRTLVTSGALSQNLSLTSSLSPDHLRCLIIERLENGLLKFEISNRNIDGTESDKTYTLLIVFSPNIKYAATDTSTDLKKAIVEWKFHSMRKL